MVAFIIGSIENRQARFVPDGVFGNDALLLRLASDPRPDKLAARWRTAGDDILDALDCAQVRGWEW